MYNREYWKNHVVDQDGKVIQQGTLMDQDHFNNMEQGISEAHTAIQILAVANMQQQRQNEAHQKLMDSEVLGETHTVKLTNTARWPFNSSMDSPTTVALNKTRKNLYYTVEATVESHAGEVGEIHITDKALNGFKVSYDGPAASVTLTIRIKGGMT